MKQVLLAFGVLIIAMIGAAWSNGKIGSNITFKPKTVSDKTFYFEPDTALNIGKESQIDLLASYSLSQITGFDVEVSYDPSMVKVTGIALNSGVFDQLLSSSIDQNLGKFRIKASGSVVNSQLKNGAQKLATIKVEGVKTGFSTLSSGSVTSATVFEGETKTNATLQMQTFKVTVK